MQIVKPSTPLKIGILGLLATMFMGLMMITTMMGSSSNPDCSGVSSTGDTSITDSASKTKRAKTVYDDLRSQGATPKAAAGIMGVWDFESGFDPKVSNTGGSGAFGIAQWLGDRKTNLLTFAASKNLKAESLEAQLKFTMYELNHTAWSQAKHVLKENDVHKAVYDWLMDYEGMSNNPEQWFLEKGPSGQPGRNPRADHWYAKFGANDTDGDSGLPTGDVDSDDDGDSTVADCQTDNSATDGTGKVPKDLPYGQNIAANKIPDDVKPFLLPHQLSDARGVSGKGWSHPGDQCVDYSVSRITALWGIPPWSRGHNGGGQAQDVVDMGGKKETAPHAGDIGSSQGYPPTAAGEPGHTWIVEHVFADGSVLLSEQNGPQSGAYIHQPKTWSIILMHPYPDGQEWHSANGGEYTPLSGKATFARPKGHMKK